MRIVSQDGTRDFPYNRTALLLRTRMYDDMEVKYVIVALFDGKEYDMGYFTDDEIAYEVMHEIRNTPETYYAEDDLEEDDDDDDIFPFMNETRVMCIVIPKEEDILRDME